MQFFFLSFFFISMPFIEPARVFIFVRKFRNFETFIFFFLLCRSFEAERVQQVTPHVRVSLSPPLRRYRASNARSRCQFTNGEGGGGGERWFTRSAINISGETPEVSPEERSWRGRWWLGERYRLHIVDPWLMYRLSYLQAVLSSPPIDPRSRYPFEIRDPEF